MSFFCDPSKNAIEGSLAFSGKPKIYRMAYISGCPHIEVESYYGQGVIVHYNMTGRSYSWEWKYRSEAWDFAQTRKLHVSVIKNDWTIIFMGMEIS